MRIGIPTETFPGERRVAITPHVLAAVAKIGTEILIEPGAGFNAGFTDDEYQQHGATIANDRAHVFNDADVIAQVHSPGGNPDAGAADLDLLRSGQILIGFCDPLDARPLQSQTAEDGIVQFSMELMPRITRAQSMDALSSQASLAGYRAVLLGAMALPKIFPMMMTAAGTLKAAKVFIVGAGVAGLQAIATAKRLGAIVSAIDVRPAVKDQVESLGAKFVMPPDTSEGEGGYAKEQTEEQKQAQQQLMADTVAESDVVITTAAIPGRPAPKLIPADMVAAMAPRSVIVDLAAERGGNCELTQPGQTIETDNGVTILGPANVPADVPYHASQSYAKNVATFLDHLIDEGQLNIDTEDEITAGTLVCRDGQIVHPRVREAMGLEPLQTAAAEGSAAT